jgi:hypothetical protein
MLGLATGLSWWLNGDGLSFLVTLVARVFFSAWQLGGASSFSHQHEAAHPQLSLA